MLFMSKCLESTATSLALNKNVVVVIPCFNGGERLRGAVQGALARVDRVIVVDDGSTDGCMESIRDTQAQIIRFQRNKGKGHALIAGTRAALELPDARVIALMDADGQHDPAELTGLFARFMEERADLLIGARAFDRRHVPWRSRVGNKVTVWVMARLCGVNLPDTQCGFRLLSHRFASRFVEHVPGGRYETEMRMLLLAVNEDYRVVSAPIATLYEPGNPSSHFRKVRDSLRIYRTLAQVFFARNQDQW
ncbi:MAG TPA: glycosyltransferase family 2 protein [Candidatus Hydrogenedentes bacterium]|nr:glycosyltransferase family 2 protein [Candidatus Hydrogenedentota bacterium]